MKSSQTKSVIPLAPDKQGLLREFFRFVRQNKKWWITPIIILLALLGIALAVLCRSGVAPFMYSRY